MGQSWLSLVLLAGVGQGPAPTGIQPVLDPEGYMVYHLDFEVAGDDRDLNGRLDEDRWERLQGRAYPFYCRALLDDTDPRAGEMSLFLDPDGASVGVRTRPLPADRRQAYRIQGYVRTKDLRRAAAWVRVEWLSDDGTHVLGHASSGPLTGTADWRRFDFPARPPQDLKLGAFRLVFSVEAGEAGSDLEAGAWFDAVTVHEQPRLTLTTGEPANLFEVGREKTLTLLASGLKAAERQACLVVSDCLGRRLETRTVALRGDFGGSTVARFPVGLDRPGLYRAEVWVGEEQAALATRAAWFAVAPCPSDRSGPSDLGVSLTAREVAAAAGPGSHPDPPAVSLERLFKRVGCRWAKFPVRPFNGGRTPEDLARRLGEIGVNLVGVLAGRPGSTETAAEALRDTADRFRTAAAQYGGRIGTWQVGLDGDASLCATGNLTADIARVSRAIRSVAIAPELGVSWSPLHPLPKACEGLDFVSLDIGSEIPALMMAEQVGRPPTASGFGSFPQLPKSLSGRKTSEVTEDFGSQAYVPITATIRMLDRSRFDREACLRDLVLRVVAAKQAGARRVFVAPLMDDRTGLLRSDGSPTEAILAWRTLIEMLDGLPFLGAAPIEGDVPNALFGDAARAVLVIWSAEGPGKAHLWLDHGAVQVSLFGERQPVEGAGGECEVAVGPMPLFITGVEPGLAATCASFAMDNPRLECAYRPQVRAVHLTNRFTARVRGRVVLTEPPGWRIDPKAFTFDLAPGARAERPVRFLLPYTAACGPTTLRGYLEVGGDRPHQAVVQTPLTLDVADLALDAVCDHAGDGKVHLRMTLRNTGTTRFSGTCYASAPGLLAAEGGGFIVEPRSQVEKRLFLDFGKASLPRHMRVCIREIRGDRFLNADVDLPDPGAEWVPLEPAPVGDESSRRN